jgi:hypothetical protein
MGGGGDGLGNLADELAGLDEWDGEEDEDGEYGDEGTSELGNDLHQSNGHINGLKLDADKTRDSGIDVSSSPLTADTSVCGKMGMLEPGPHLSPVQQQKQRKTSRHRRQYSEYDGSDYGESDLEEVPLISPALEARMAAVEGLARRGMETNGSADDGIVERTVERLRDLGSQSGVEGGATR